MKNQIYALLLAFAALPTNAQNGAKSSFMTAYQKDGQEETMSSAGISFVKDGERERYAWQPTDWQKADYSSLGAAFDIRNVRSIFRCVESDNQFTVALPEEAPITDEDIVVEAYGQEIVPTDDSQYSTGASFVSVCDQDGNPIYDCIVSVDTLDTQRSIELNALETAYTMLLPIFPGIFETTSDGILSTLKSLLAELPETQALAEAIDRSIVQHGYLDMGSVEAEYDAAVERIIEKTGLRNNYLKPGAASTRRQVTPQPPAVINGNNGARRLKLVMNSSKWIHDSLLGKTWRCNLTAYNSGRFAYTAWVRATKDDDGLLYSPVFDRFAIINHYDMLRDGLLKPQRSATFMGTFTDPVTAPLKAKSWEGIANYFSDTYRLFTEEGFGFEDMTWDCTEKKLDMSFHTSRDVVLVLGPADNDLMMYYNILKTIIDPIVKKIAKGLTNAEDEDYMMNFCIELVADEDYRADFFEIFNADKNIGTKAKEILELTWPKMSKFLDKYLHKQLMDRGPAFVKDHWGFIDSEKLQQVLGRIKEAETWNKHLKTVEKVGDITLGILGLAERSCYYDLSLDFDDSDIIVPTDGLVAYYPFNGNANDESGNGNDGTVKGNVQLETDRFGRPNSAYRFPGQPFNYISVPDNESLHLSTFTLNAWVYTDANDYGWGWLINKGRDIDNGTYFLRVTSVCAFNDYYGDNAAYLSETPSTKEWHMITGTVEGRTARIYLDGKLKHERLLSHAFSYSGSSPLTLGMHYYSGVPSGWAYPLLGVLDDVRIYNRALNASEIRSLYREPEDRFAGGGAGGGGGDSW